MLVFTDGGCIKNGKKNAKASYAVYMNNTIIRGHVMPYEYVYDGKLICNTTEVTPSNNRGELLALIHAFIEILKECKNSIDKSNDYVVYSDSQICVKTINEWYPNRLKKGAIHEFKNLDLIKILMDLFNHIKSICNIKVEHTRSHQKIHTDTTLEQKKIIGGNNIVDKYASELLTQNTLLEYEKFNI